MEWGAQQQQALKSVADWLKTSDQQVFRMFGYAGVGKTTLAHHFAEGVEGGVMFMCYTGKAAHVMRQKGCEDASTIHSAIYHSNDKSRALLRALEAELVEVLHEIRVGNSSVTQEILERLQDDNQAVRILRKKIKTERDSQSQPMFTLNSESEVRHASLVVIDECSMVDARMGMDLLSFGTKVLVLGDPAQLPPIGGAGFFTDVEKPDVMLTEIHRQARDNPIIEMATRVRNEEELEIGSYGESRVVDKADIDHNDGMAASQILVGRNKTRHGTNRRIRSLLGHNSNGDLPEAGDRLVCLHNNHDLGLLNGAIWMVLDVGEISDNRVYMTVVPEDGGTPQEVDAHAGIFRGEELHWAEKRDAEQFDYGYALTVHKSQGSQWRDVLLFDESHCFRDHRWRWLYTGLTRASEKITLVRM